LHCAEATINLWGGEEGEEEEEEEEEEERRERSQRAILGEGKGMGRDQSYFGYPKFSKNNWLR
jgi:hypothetical protein